MSSSLTSGTTQSEHDSGSGHGKRPTVRPATWHRSCLDKRQPNTEAGPGSMERWPVVGPASSCRGTPDAYGYAMAIVLVVNDDRDMLDMYESMLRPMGHRPITMVAIHTGPETVREVGADVLLVDLEAPDEALFGLRLIQEVRGDPELQDLPIILATGARERVGLHRDLFDSLGVPVLIKPFSINALEKKLRAALEASTRSVRHVDDLATPA